VEFCTGTYKIYNEVATLTFLNSELTLAHGQQYQHYIGIGLLTFAAIQVIKSGTRSLLIPMLATILGAVISRLTSSETLLTYSASFYQYLMVVGIIGLGISVLTIARVSHLPKSSALRFEC
jgi:hypothetical protein